MEPATCALGLGFVMVLAGVATTFSRKLRNVLAFVASLGYGLVGLSLVMDSVNIISVVLASLCFAFGLLIVLATSLADRRQRRQAQRQQKGKEAQDGLEEFNA